MEIEKNMLRDRADCLPSVTDEQWNLVCEHNREMVKEFVDANKHLSAKSIKQYISGLRIFFNFVREKLNNKPLYKLTKRDFIKYFAFLQDHNLSSSALSFKKSAVSTLCNYVENIVAEEEEDYKNFRNPTKAIREIPKNKVYEKVPVTKEEYDKLMSHLLEKEMYIESAWVAFAFNCGSRKEEILQIKSEVVNYPLQGKFYESHNVRAKGRGVSGSIYKIIINEEAMKYIKLWLEKRGYEHEYVFTVKYNGIYKKISSDWANDLCQKVISPFLGRRINPHLFRASAATNAINNGKDLKAISKHMLHHQGVQVTELYIVRDDVQDKNSLFD